MVVVAVVATAAVYQVWFVSSWTSSSFLPLHFTFDRISHYGLLIPQKFPVIFSSINRHHPQYQRYSHTHHLYYLSQYYHRHR